MNSFLLGHTTRTNSKSICPTWLREQQPKLLASDRQRLRFTPAIMLRNYWVDDVRTAQQFVCIYTHFGHLRARASGTHIIR